MRIGFLLPISSVFVVAILVIPLSTVMAAQHQQTSSTTSSPQSNGSSFSVPSTTLPLKTIFKQVENSVVQITSKIPTGAPNALNPQSPNATALGSGYIYDKQGHLITNSHVVGDAKIVDVTFPDGNR
jgi:S1-C subfamily serine protease